MGARTLLQLALLVICLPADVVAQGQGGNQRRTPVQGGSAGPGRSTAPRDRTATRTNRAGDAPPAQRTFTSDGKASSQPSRSAPPRIVTQPNGVGAAPRGPAATPALPTGFPLTEEQQRRVDQILAYWERNTSTIKTYQCAFVRYNFDFVFGTKDAPKSADRGRVRYSSPDKGEMRVDEVYNINAAAKEAKDRFVKQDVQFGEYWVCDGQAVYQFDSRSKTLTETRLPEEMRGKSIGEGPLPFMFGAKAETMQARYWIREVTPEQNPQGEYFLEAIPKKQEDAANFDKILVQLAVSGEQLLPRAMKVFSKQAYVRYEFSDHAVNDTRHRVAGFFDSFVSPKTPRGWTKIVEDWSGNRLDGDAQAAKAEPASEPKTKR